MKRWRWGTVAALGISALGCSSDEDDAREALERWQRKGPDDYVFWLSAYGIRRVVVRNGGVEGATSVYSGIHDAQGARTMTQLLEDAVSIASEDHHEYRASFDPDLGYVRELFADGDEDAIDDEVYFSVPCFDADVENPEACLLPVLDDECPGERAAPREPNDAFPYCANAAVPLGRFAGSEDVCCPGRRGQPCADLATSLQAEVLTLRSCEADEDCRLDLSVGWPSTSCQLPLHIQGLDATTANALLDDWSSQSCDGELPLGCIPDGNLPRPAVRCIDSLCTQPESSEP